MKYYIIAFIVFVFIGAGLFYCINNFINSTSEIQPLEAAILEESEKAKNLEKELPPLDSLEKVFLDSMDYQIIDGYTEINWKTLSFVDFEDKFVDTLDQYIPFPIFKTPVKMFENEPVMIKGYTIPIEETGDENTGKPIADLFAILLR